VEAVLFFLVAFVLPLSSIIYVKDSMIISGRGISRPGIFAMMAFSLIGVILRYSDVNSMFLWLILGIELVIGAWILVRYFFFKS